MATELTSKLTTPPAWAPFPIVGVGASAGGLESFKQLLGAVPADCEMAFVLVPHLDPNCESQMVAILSKTSSLLVVEATDGMVVESNHVYVIPAKKFLSIRDGAFELCEPPAPQGHEIAIDFFLRSLAKDQGTRSIGIVLSGTGSHGTLGIRDIKLAGGMAIAQQPTSAGFDSMPSSIINERLADFVLPPAEMAAALMQYAQQPYINSHRPAVPNDTGVEEDQLTAILSQLRKHSGYDFGSYRKNMILRRIQRRMGLHHLDRLEQYVERLSEDPKEASALYRDLLISVTAFFRDAEVYETLSTELLSDLKNRDAASFPFRVWVPGCATGEEAYSLAMLLIEVVDEATSPRANGLLTSSTSNPIKIFASDVDEAAIAIARAGVYPSSIASDVSPARLERFFVKTDKGQFQIGKQLRDSIVFSRQNVINDPPFSILDLISCRNLLIYFEPELQQRVLSLFHFALSDDSLLMLGQAESLGQADDLFKPIAEKCRLFAKVPSRRRSQVPFPLIATHSLKRPLAIQTPSISPRQGYKALVEKTLFSHYVPATALINRHYEVLYVTGPLVDYLEFPPGEPNQNLLAMCRPGLRTKLRFACQKSLAEETDTEIPARFKRGDDSVQCKIDVRILKTGKEAEPLLLISFADTSPAALISSDASEPVSLEQKTSSEVEQLQRDLKSNGEELGGVIEELEAANEDLKTSNEEIMSMNEELQSANEELETSKEELQSLNEELSTVNSELLEKVTQLDVANNDILNLIASTEIATLFMDNDLMIQRFTPPTLQLLNLRATDIGRPLGDITTRFHDDRLISDCRKVIQDSAPIQCEVEADNARLYLRRILPYRSHGDKQAGVVITFVDLTDRLALEKSLKQSKESLQAILDAAADAILTVDGDGIIASLNPATERLFGYARNELFGKSVLPLLFCGSRSHPTLDTPNALQTLASSATAAAKRKDGSHFDAELTLGRIDHLSLFIVIIRDVSQRKELQTKILSIASDEQRRIGQELHDGTQQELTGLSLIAGTIEDFFQQRVQLGNDDQPTLTLPHVDLSRLMLNASKLVKGLKEANQHVQSLSHGIMPVQIDAEGLHSALTELANETTVKGKVVCNFVHSGSLKIANNTVATHLYRIAQEAINNAQRHGAVGAIKVSLSGDEHQIQLEISDNGIGLDIFSMKLNGKLNQATGLQIMEYRASVIGGKLSISKGKNNGTIVTCTVPRQRNLG